LRCRGEGTFYLFEKLERRTLFSLPPGVTASGGAAYVYDPPADTLSLTSGTLTFSQDVGSASSLTLQLSASGSGSSLVFNSTEHLDSLTLTNGALATLALSGSDTVSDGILTSYGTTLAQANTKALVLNSLSIPASGTQGTLDLTNNAMVLNYTGSGATALSASEALVESAFDSDFWDGPGVGSSEVAADS
jgi:hypothetical protein